MVTQILQFAALGLGSGAVYALLGLGIVLVYRGSGVINFAHGGVGMAGAYLFYEMRADGTPTWVCWLVAVGLAASAGVAIHLLIMRPLRRAPALTRLIATLGLLSILLAYGEARYGSNATIVTKLLPSDGFVLWGHVVVGRDRLMILVFTIVLAGILALIYRFTPFGIATTAVAESRQTTAAQGISPDRVAAINWAIGSALAVVGTIFIVNIAGLSVDSLALLVVPALAAALAGGMRGFALTCVGGLLIGILQSEVDWLNLYLTERWHHPVNLDGWPESVPFLLIIVLLVVRGRALPLRGEAAEVPPALGDGVVRPVLLVPTVVVFAVASVVLSGEISTAIATSAAVGIVALSLVVVTGYTGQLSLAQFSLAGVGAWLCSVLIAQHGWPFEVAAAAGVAGTIPIGILVGLPSLRTRGVNLAIATLGLAVVIEALVLGNGTRNGGITGLQLGTLTVFGVNFDPIRHPHNYALLCCLVFCILGLLVANLRRSRSGRRLIALRANERAAAAIGINVMASKVYAFGLAAGIAAAGGILIVARQPVAIFLPTFSVVESIFIVVYAVIGGIGFLSGSVVAGLLASGGLVTTVLDNWSGGRLNGGPAVQVIIGFGLIVQLVFRPNGLAYIRRSDRSRVPFAYRPRVSTVGDSIEQRVSPRTLSLRNVGVRFGVVQALSEVSLDIYPGEVVGLIGPNGAGKTTLIDAVSGFSPSEGEVSLDTKQISRWSPARRSRAGISRSFQSLELFETMTVFENLQTAADPRSMRSALLDLVWPGRARLDGFGATAVVEFGLLPYLRKRPDQLSYGTRRLVAIARAVAAGPSVLLLDEPAAGLDDTERAELASVIRRLADRWGIAVLLVEHDIELVLDVCDRVTVLDQGSQIATGTPSEVRGHSSVVKAYIGDQVTPLSAKAPAGPRAKLELRSEPPSSRPAEGAPVLQVTDLHAGYGDLAAVRGLNLELFAGEVVVLLGPNGAGKTTTLMALAGELKPMEGQIELLGSGRTRPLHRLAREGVALVAAENSIVKSLTTKANLRLGRGSVARACELFPEITKLLPRRAGLLSGGEQQMVALARALAGDPKLLLVDELSLGLAPLVTKRLLAMLRVAADHGVAVLFVEQHTGAALAVADRAIVLRQGRVALTGSAAQLQADSEGLESAYLGL